MSNPSPSSGPTPPAPEASALELERLRQEVKARLFGSARSPLKIGRYQVIDCIGSGGMGIVYSARDERLGRTVAIKLLKPELSGSQASNLGAEAQSLAKLAHPNVVAVYDVGEHDGQLFVAMEYIEGQNLRRWLLGKRTLDQVLDVFLAAGEGLAAAHKAGLVHRDFKPDNVLVGLDGRPRILDFGLARAPDGHEDTATPPSFADDAEATATSMSRHGVLLGTPAYMAPEQHLGERADARSDQFGFCVALYQAVYGRLPFPSDDLRALSLAIVGGRITPPPVEARVPASLRALLRRGLSVDPSSRFSSMDALLAELRTIRGELDVGASPLATAPTQPSDELVYDTQAIAQVFGAQHSGPDERRPPLSEHEVREIADEVGLELSDLRPPSPAPVPTHGHKPAKRKRNRDRTYMGMPTQIHCERALPAVPSPEVTRRIVRELEQNLGGAGLVEHFGSGLAWSNSESEASIDRRPEGALLTVRRNFYRLARQRRRKGAFFGLFGGLVAGGVLTDIVPSLLAVVEPFLVFGGAAAGVMVGYEVVKKIHQRHMEEERRALDWVGERVQVLVEADAPQALPPGTRRA
ncbi:serine/threonine protein kinase [Pseudenhygromyxa sp. WMMC2535]|uniref:protein kinase domain-containing protein n=1 Tax=Pseudenhygromyxa sp. WMMC2535 TaxID=2712867 RepID=UPI0015537E5A|nr:serine/threonine protein kinase [Pseudenhygromyxa sp. WMMC2535]